MRFLVYLFLFLQLPLSAQEIRVVDYELLKDSLYESKLTNHLIDSIRTTCESLLEDRHQQMQRYYQEIMDKVYHSCYYTVEQQNAWQDSLNSMQENLQFLANSCDSLHSNLVEQLYEMQKIQIQYYINSTAKLQAINTIIPKTQTAFVDMEVDLTPDILSWSQSNTDEEYRLNIRQLEATAFQQIHKIFNIKD